MSVKKQKVSLVLYEGLYHITEADLALLIGVSYQAIHKRNYPFQKIKALSDKNKYLPIQHYFKTLSSRDIVTADGETVSIDEIKLLKTMAETRKLDLHNAKVLKNYAPLASFERLLGIIVPTIKNSLAMLNTNIKQKYGSIDPQLELVIDECCADAMNNAAKKMDKVKLSDIIEDSDYD